MQTPPPEELPLVSMIIPAFNHEAYIADAIHSVLDQTYPRVELIVIDDCSTDGTAAIVDKLAEEFGFTFVRNSSNLGVNASAMKAWALSSGEYVGGVASDDMIVVEKTARQVDYLLTTGADGVFSTGYILRSDGNTELIDMNHVARLFANGKILDHVYCDDSSGPLFQSGLFRRDAITDLFPYRDKFKSDDWIILIKLLEGYQIGFLNEPFFYYRQHDQNSFRKYWATLPMRMEVIAHATPERLRTRAIANLLLSQAHYLLLDGMRGPALKFLLSSLAMDQSPRRLAGLLTGGFKGVGRRIRRRLKGAGGPEAGINVVTQRDGKSDRADG